MGPAKLLADLRQRGVQLASDHGQLAVEGELDDQDLELLRKHKDGILELLREEARHGGKPIAWPRDDVGSCSTCHPAPAPNGAQPPKVDASQPQQEEDLAPLDNELVRRLEALGYAIPPFPNSERQFAKRAGIDPATVAKARDGKPVTARTREKIQAALWELSEPARQRRREEQERWEAYIRPGKGLDRESLEEHENLVHEGAPMQWRETEKDRYDCIHCVPPQLPEPPAETSPPPGSSESPEPEPLDKRRAQTAATADPLPEPVEEPSEAPAEPGESTQAVEAEPAPAASGADGLLGGPSPRFSGVSADLSGDAWPVVHELAPDLAGMEVHDLLLRAHQLGAVIGWQEDSVAGLAILRRDPRLEIQQGTADAGRWSVCQRDLREYHRDAVERLLFVAGSKLGPPATPQPALPVTKPEPEVPRPRPDRRIFARLAEKAELLPSSQPRMDGNPGPTAGFAVTLRYLRDVGGGEIVPGKNGEPVLRFTGSWRPRLSDSERLALTRLIREVEQEQEQP